MVSSVPVLKSWAGNNCASECMYIFEIYWLHRLKTTLIMTDLATGLRALLVVSAIDTFGATMFCLIFFFKVWLGNRKLPAPTGAQAGGLGAGTDRDNHSVKGIHAPLTCYCELPAALADNCHVSLGKGGQRQAGWQPFCVCRYSSPLRSLGLKSCS